MKFLGLCLLFLLPSVACALSQNDCEDVDIRDFHPRLREHLSKPMDQGNLSWCFGFAASDLMSVEAGEPVSPLHLTAIYNQRMRANTLFRMGYEARGSYNRFKKGEERELYESGNAGVALNLISGKSICKYDEFDTGYNFKLIIERIEMLREALSENDTNIAIHHYRQLLELAPALSLNLEDFKKDINDFLPQILGQACGEKIQIPKTRAKILLRPPLRILTKGYFEAVNESLSNGKPVVIDFDMDKIYKEKNATHVSSVVARRWKNNQCQYKVRDSFGEGCDQYDSAEIIECLPEEGSYWVDFEKFREMAKRAVILK